MNSFAFNAVRLCFIFTEASFIGFVFQKLTISCLYSSLIIRPS